MASSGTLIRINRPCLLLAQSGHGHGAERCPLLGVKRTSHFLDRMSAFDPKRTSTRSVVLSAFLIQVKLSNAFEGNALGGLGAKGSMP
jgi:hypothetical protein